MQATELKALISALQNGIVNVTFKKIDTEEIRVMESTLKSSILEENGITVNKNGVPNDPRSFIETSGIRIGTAAETTRGHDEEWFKELALKIVTILK